MPLFPEKKSNGGESTFVQTTPEIFSCSINNDFKQFWQLNNDFKSTSERFRAAISVIF